MRGIRLLIGLVVMGIAVPAILFFLLDLGTLGALFTVSATCFLSWGVADLAAGILERPRLAGRTPGRVFRDVDVAQTRDEKKHV
ncbi:MAG TPA: hypothetical protein VGE86_06415 [Thermoanaerobaculia bacterium]